MSAPAAPIGPSPGERLLIDQAPVAYVSVDVLGAVRDWNPAAQSAFGWTHAEVLGRDLGDLLLSDTRAELHRKQLEEVRTTASSRLIGRHLDVPMSHRDGRLLRVDCVVWSVEDHDGEVTLHAFLNDVTARRAAEDDLRRATDDLSVFTAAMAHDLRTPLTAIKGLAQLLEHELDHPVAAEWASRIDDAADRGVVLIEDVLAYLGVGRVLLDTERVDLTALLEEVAETQLDAALRPATIEVGALPHVIGDPRLLAQLFGNLVGNAFKHVPADRDVRVEVTAVPDLARGGFVVHVDDNGDTIEPGDRARIFAMFERGITAAGGSGVGLAVSRRIAELHDGDISVGTTPGGGTRFAVRLPG